MVDISSLLRSLPVLGLKTEPVASIRGFSELLEQPWKEKRVTFLMPPAGSRVPFVDPIQAMTLLFRYHGADAGAAHSRAVAAYASLRLSLGRFERVRFYASLDADTSECIPAPAMIRYLRHRRLVPDDVTDFLDHAASSAGESTVIRFFASNGMNAAWSVAQLPDLPPPEAMIEFVPGAPWHEPQVHRRGNDAYEAWRESICPVAQDLGRALRKELHYFGDLNDLEDDDFMHRFLVLHWCCTCKPSSLYTQFLVEASGASDVDELKRALLDPRSYWHPYHMSGPDLTMDTFTELVYAPRR